MLTGQNKNRDFCPVNESTPVCFINDALKACNYELYCTFQTRVNLFIPSSSNSNNSGQSQILSSHIEDIIMKNNIKTLKLVLGNKEVKTLITGSLKSKNENTS